MTGSMDGSTIGNGSTHVNGNAMSDFHHAMDIEEVVLALILHVMLDAILVIVTLI